jgi:hypothetical protein
MDIDNIIQKIIDNGKIEDMRELSNMLQEGMQIIKNYDEDCYKKFEIKLYKMAYGNVLSPEMAEKIVAKMRPYGKRWSLEETRQIQQQRGINNISPINFFVVLNSAYNDYNDIFRDNLEDYIRFAIDFIQDEDAKNGKVFLYFTTIPE